jgi:hypothetical protein
MPLRDVGLTEAERRTLPSPEWERAHYEKLQAQGIDIKAGRAAINRGDTATAERVLDSIKTPSRSEIAVLERRINIALQRAPKRPRSMPVRRGHDRGRPRRRVRRTVRLTAHGPPGRPRPSDDDPASHELALRTGVSA